MDSADRQRIEAFLAKWLGSEGNERANYQSFLGDLCIALGVEPPPPKGTVPGDPYCFDKDIKFYGGKLESTRFADFYKEGHLLLEAKQGSNESSKGHGKRGTKVYQDNLQKAFNQAKSYAYNRMLGSLPPFLITCDIGSHFELWEGFSGEYGSYGARQRINLADLAQPEIFDRFVKIFTDPQALNPEKLRARVTREVAAELAKLSRWLEENPPVPPHPLTPSPKVGEGGQENSKLPSPTLGEGPGERAKEPEQRANHPQQVAQFLMRCIFTMFAEDVELLKGEVFTRALRDRWIPHPETFQPEIEQLWRTMNTGGSFGFETVLQFNGSFFENATAMPLPKEQLEVLYAAAAKDWSQVEPAIFGTLLERALEKKERSRLGAHYTPRSYVERLVRPVVMEPLRQEWDEVELELKRLLEPEPGKEEPTDNQRKKAKQEIETFLTKLRTIKILDPACGTGNFLYVALDLLKGLEQEVQTRLVDVAGEVQLNVLDQINPSQFLGIEINPRAAAIAELVIWIGYLQWYFKRFGNAEPPEPVLQAFGNIECRDAVLAYDDKEPDVDPKTGQVRTRWGGRKMKHPVTGEEVPDPTDQVVIYKYLNARAAEWPEADYVVSNPPFIGVRRMRESLGDGYTETLREKYSDIPETVDYVMYWWHKSAELVSLRKISRFGLITTNTIRQAWQRVVVEKHLNSKKPVRINFAIPDHPWSDNGADVRISMTSVELESLGNSIKDSTLGTVVSEDSEILDPEESSEKTILRWKRIGKIFGDLRSGIDVSISVDLKANSELASTGIQFLGSGFILNREEAIRMGYGKTSGPLSRNNEVIKEYRNGKDVMGKSRELLVIDFDDFSQEKASQYLEPFQRVLETVKPERDVHRDKQRRDKWWRFGRANTKMRRSLLDLKRYIATSQTSKHRIFQFLDSKIIPDQKIVAIAIQDAYGLAILSSHIHVKWATEAGGWLGVGNDPVYNHSRCFNTFPFPDPTPEQKQKIRELGERLDAHRKQVQAAHPDITITGMYNLLEKLRAGEPFTEADRDYNNRALVSTLKQIHDDLDLAVLDAYGWPHSITDDQILENLVALNAQRAEEERNGLIRWLRPEYQAPEQAQPVQTALEGIVTETEAIIEPAEQRKWPTQPKDQLAAIRDLLRTSPGEWTVPQIAAQFTGKNTQKKLTAIADNLERLEWFGLVICEKHNGTAHWHHTEAAVA